MNRFVIALSLALVCVPPIPHSSSAWADDAGSSLASDAAVTSPVAAPLDAGIPGPNVEPAPAPAGAPSVVIDPAHPSQTYENARSAIVQYGVLWGGMLILFGVGTLIIKNNDETHWLSKDHYLPLGVGVLGVVGALLNAKFGAGSWTAVFAALGAAVALVIQKPTPGKSSSATT